ncbi:hypothetical protein NC652_006880 [Populus alba x Populus x berolinensis]|nr:hypothetical protein NC652_006880 [Populus alba x Populus x berolinensis]
MQLTLFCSCGKSPMELTWFSKCLNSLNGLES